MHPVTYKRMVDTATNQRTMSAKKNLKRCARWDVTVEADELCGERRREVVMKRSRLVTSAWTLSLVSKKITSVGGM